MRRAIVLLLALAAASGCRRRPISDPTAGSGEAPPVKILYPSAPGSFAKTVARLKPSLVHLHTTAAVKGGPGDWFPVSGPGEGLPAEPTEQMRRSLGTGFLVDTVGTILTNAHVVGKDREIRARLADGSDEKATIVGQDARLDVAVLKIEPRAGARLTPVRFGDSDALEVGEWVVALGEPFGVGPTISVGVLSAKERRDLPLGQSGNWSFLQTDAAIHAGNSGGPLVNVLGEVVGIATAVAGDAPSPGVGFAVPMRTVQKVLPMLKREGRVVRTWIGIYMERLTREAAERAGMKTTRGALVTSVVPRGPAERAGVRGGDIIIAFDNREVTNASELPWIASLAGVDRQVPIKVWRSGKAMSFSLRTERMPE
jgi:serine protease Do